MNIEKKQNDVSDQQSVQKKSELNTQETAKVKKERANDLENSNFVESKTQQRDQKDKNKPKESDTRKSSLNELDSIHINESKKETTNEQKNQSDLRKQDVSQLSSISDGRKKFEDYSMAELREMGDGKASQLNADFRERYEAESLGMSVEEYRAHLDRIKEANKDDLDESPQEHHEEKELKSELNNQNIIVDSEKDKHKDNQFDSNKETKILETSNINENEKGERNTNLEVTQTKSEDNISITGNNNNDLSSNSDSERINENYEKSYENNFDDTKHSEFEDAGKQSNEISNSLEVSNKIENVDSKFDRSNFTTENTYDIHATEETKNLVSKSIVPIREIGFDESVKIEALSESYTKEEINILKAEREKIDAPDESTVMQKVIGVDTGNIEKDLSEYLNPRDLDSGRPKNADVYGFVSKAQDSAPFTRTPQECYYNLRLDYDGTVYTNPQQPVYIIRFTNGKNYEIPYNKEFGGEKDWPQPCTGNGFIGNKEHLIPEYRVYPQNKQGAVVTDGAIYRINPDGNEELVANFNKKNKCFVLYKED